MKNSILKLLLAFVMSFPCLFGLVACKDKGVKVTDILVELKGGFYTITNNTISIPYGTKVELDSDDFIVTAIFDNDRTEIIPVKSNSESGFTFESNLPSDVVTPVGEYTLTFMYEEADNVVITVKVVAATVNMYNVDWDYKSAFTYDGQEKEVKIINLPEGVSVEYQGSTKATNAGEYTVKAIFTYIDTDNFNPIPDMDLSWKIEKASLNVTNVVMTDYVYDGTLKQAKIKSINLPDSVEVDQITGDISRTDAGDYNVSVSFKTSADDKDNYIIPNVSAVWKITPTKFTNVGSVSLAANYDYTYNGQEREVLLNIDNLSEDVNVMSIVGNKATNAGVYSIEVALEYVGESGNYNSADSIVLTNAWQIKAAPLTIIINNKSITYGEDASNAGYYVSGLVNGETQGVLKGTPVYQYDKFYQDNGKVGSYFISVTGLSADNYELTYSPGILTVEKANVGSFGGVALKVAELTYNGLEQTIAESLSDFVGVPAGVKIASITGNKAKDFSIIGYMLTVKFTQDDTGNFNNVEFTSNYAWKINRKTLTVTANNNTIIYGDEATNDGYTVNKDDLVGEDTEAVIKGTATYTYGDYEVGSSVGEYPIVIGKTDLFAENYKVEVLPGILTVVAKKNW